MTGTCGASAARTALIGESPALPSKAARQAPRINAVAKFPVTMSPRPFARSFRCRRRADAKADDIDGIALARILVIGRRFLLRCVGHAAQRQRQRADLLRKHQGFGLAGAEFKRGGLADDDLLAVFLLDILVDRQHADIAENG